MTLYLLSHLFAIIECKLMMCRKLVLLYLIIVKDDQAQLDATFHYLNDCRILIVARVHSFLSTQGKRREALYNNATFTIGQKNRLIDD